MMRVVMITHTPMPERVVALAMRRCYSTKPIEELGRELDATPGYQERLIKDAFEKHTFDVIEHAVFTFDIEGISRITSHQLVRHRLASYDQESQRFSNTSREECIIPPSCMKNPDVLQRCKDKLDQDMFFYNWLIGHEVPKEDARYFLPHNMGTKIVMTINARSLNHVFHMRTAPEAQWEIKAMAYEMLGQCRKVAPDLFASVVEM